jgi:hypothetical protein
MARHFEVVGYDVLGDDTDPTTDVPPPATNTRQLIRLPAKSSWRQGQLAPGVNAPDEGLVPLPMMPLTNSGTFTSTISTITWQGQLQKPFRAERYLCTTVRTGTTAVGRLLGQFFVGTDLQMADITGIDLEVIGAPTAFGTRMTHVQAPPGVLIRIPTALSSGLTSPDTIFATMMFLGRWIH